MHHQSIWKPAREMHRFKHNIAPKLMGKLFNETNVPYTQSQGGSFCSYNVKTVLYDTETLSYLELIILILVPFKIKILQHQKV